MSETTPPTASALPEPGPVGDAPVSPDPAPMPENDVVVAGETLSTDGAPSADTGDESGAPAEDTTTPGLSPAQTAARLAELFPALFGTEPKPIKLRIQADLQQRAPGVFQRRTLSWFLSRHTTTNAYLKALLHHSTRFDLDGQPAGEISAEHKQAAETELARRRAIAQAKRQAARAPQGPGAPRPPRADRAGPPAAGVSPDAASGAVTAADGAQPAADAPAQAPRQRPEGRPGARPERRQDARPPAGQHPARGGDARRQGPAGQPGHGGGARPAQGPRDERARPPRPSPADRRGPRPGGAVPGPGPNTMGPRAHAAPAASANPPAPPQDPAQRERWQLLRAWEGSALSKANFCALKRLSEADFDAQIAQARAERSPGKSAG